MINALTARRITEEVREACKNNPAYEQKMENIFEAISRAAKNGHSSTQFTFSSADYSLPCFDEYAQETLVKLGYDIKTAENTISIYW